MISVYSDIAYSELFFLILKVIAERGQSQEKALKIRLKSENEQTILKTFFDL